MQLGTRSCIFSSADAKYYSVIVFRRNLNQILTKSCTKCREIATHKKKPHQRKRKLITFSVKASKWCLFNGGLFCCIKLRIKYRKFWHYEFFAHCAFHKNSNFLVQHFNSSSCNQRTS